MGARPRPTVVAARDTSEEVLLPAPCVREVLYGPWRKAGQDRRFAAAAGWFATTLLGERGLRILHLDAAGLAVAARLRAQVPSPPSRRRKWVRRSPIAAWPGLRISRSRRSPGARGCPLLTENARGFAALGAALANFYP